MVFYISGVLRSWFHIAHRAGMKASRAARVPIGGDSVVIHRRFHIIVVYIWGSLHRVFHIAQFVFMGASIAA